MAETDKTTTTSFFGGTPEERAIRRRREWIATIAILAVIVFIAVLSSSNDDKESKPAAVQYRSRTITAVDVSPWPFTVTGGILRCRGINVVTFETDGVEYALNGPAQAVYPQPGRLWAEDPQLGYGLKKSMGPTIAMGLALC
ncbi:hypothetical protein [Kitasatospora sp. NPDC090091]|uniref:hypothetical protein n=1 Tax=Kitasatospora sp. NPDC090091 TaxID=3364081 RepID=UPI0037F65EAB